MVIGNRFMVGYATHTILRLFHLAIHPPTDVLSLPSSWSIYSFSQSS